MTILLKVFLNLIKSCEIKIYLEAYAAMVKKQKFLERGEEISHLYKNITSKDCNKKDQYKFLSQFSHQLSRFSAT